VKRYPRLVGLVLFCLLVASIQMGDHLYHWYAYQEERLELTLLREQLVDAGAEMIEAQLTADRLRDELENADQLLEARRRGIEAYNAHANQGALPGHLYASYRRDLDTFNAQIFERNQRLNELNAAIVRRNSAAHRYNVLVDSMKSAAERAREPYFPIPLPAEAATERGITGPAALADHAGTAGLR
jgi:hypothetical protein